MEWKLGGRMCRFLDRARGWVGSGSISFLDQSHRNRGDKAHPRCTCNRAAPHGVELDAIVIGAPIDVEGVWTLRIQSGGYLLSQVPITVSQAG